MLLFFVDKSGDFDVIRFLDVVKTFRDDDEDKKMEFMFEFLDKNNDGIIDIEELVYALKLLNQKHLK